MRGEKWQQLLTTDSFSGANVPQNHLGRKENDFVYGGILMMTC